MDPEPLTSPSAPRQGRRGLLRNLGLAALGLGAAGYVARVAVGEGAQHGAWPDLAKALDRKNFASVYGDPALKAEFQLFLTNVFHLYPEDELHAFIARTVAEVRSDPAAYQRIARELPALKPFLGVFRYALPALSKQKRVMAEQTVRLLGERRRFHGYLELGSHGRYLDALHDHLRIEGPIFTSAPKPPSYSPSDVVDRGRLTTFGEAVPWTDYEPLALPKASLELVTVYIGLHHAAVEKREAFIGSIREAMVPGGKLILRDHDVTSERMEHLVGLAHDVFNVGTEEPWHVNERERRNFYPLAFIVDFLSQRGFRPDPGRLLQPGDPTLNTLLSFSRV